MYLRRDVRLTPSFNQRGYLQEELSGSVGDFDALDVRICEGAAERAQQGGQTTTENNAAAWSVQTEERRWDDVRSF